MAVVPSLAEQKVAVSTDKKKNRPVTHTCNNPSPAVTNILISKLMWVKFTPYSTDFC
jgi:hypothetical protein